MLQYRIQCTLAGVTDGPGADAVTVSERMHRLTAWNEACKTLRWTDPDPTPVPMQDLPEWVGAFGPAYCELYEEKLVVVQPPSPSRGRESREWTIRVEDLGFSPSGVAYDHSHRVLALLEEW